MHGRIGSGKMASRFVLTFFVLLLPMCVSGTDHHPWLALPYEFVSDISVTYQNYSDISSGSHLKKDSASDFFISESLANSKDDMGLEIEIVEACSRKQKGDLDHIEFTGRYVWLDDVAGDPISLTQGISYIVALRSSVHDISSFHHGRNEMECFLSVGKETPKEDYWESRWWGFFALGIADSGSPWTRARLEYGKSYTREHKFSLFADSLWGFGGKKLHIKKFHGYGPVGHQSIDLGIGYTYQDELYGNVQANYTYRVYARNFPAYAHRLQIEWVCFFGL